MGQDFSLRFLGTGSALADSLGSSAAVLERGGRPLLLIDCGLDTLQRYRAQYSGALPPAVFLTHTHLDHVGGLEGLFYKACFDPERRGQIRLYVPVAIVETLHRRIADYPEMLAEGGTNFWDCFQLIPVSESFWHENLAFKVFPVLHHGYRSAYGIALPGRFLYSGDTRPIPEAINHFASGGETLFHDGCLAENPSHTNVARIDRYYRPEQLERMVFYHYGCADIAARIEAMGYVCAKPGEVFRLGATATIGPTAPEAPALQLLEPRQGPRAG